MNGSIRRLVSFGVAVLALAAGFASGPAPARAATTTLMVDDDNMQCHKAAYHSIQEALAAAPADKARIVVCAGLYTAPTGTIQIANKTNLKLIGKKGAVIQPPSNPYHGQLISVTNSTNVMIQGFTIDGLYQLDDTYGISAIFVSGSSVKIHKNTIQNWATPGFATDNNGIMAIMVSSSTPLRVEIAKNKFLNFQSRGIEVMGAAVIDIKGNTMTTTRSVINPPTAITVDTPSLGPISGTIRGNRITMDADLVTINSATAIQLYEVAPVKVTGNIIKRVDSGIYFSDTCAYRPSAAGNSITGNKLYDVYNGIRISANAPSGCTVSIDGTRVTRNRIINTIGRGGSGIALYALTADATGVASAQSMLIKGNTITNFDTGLFIQPNNPPTVLVGGTLGPNKVK